jgi:hypothetical protein
MRSEFNQLFLKIAIDVALIPRFQTYRSLACQVIQASPDII